MGTPRRPSKSDLSESDLIMLSTGINLCMECRLTEEELHHAWRDYPEEVRRYSEDHWPGSIPWAQRRFGRTRIRKEKRILTAPADSGIR
jgi:hypothetical protein